MRLYFRTTKQEADMTTDLHELAKHAYRPARSERTTVRVVYPAAGAGLALAEAGICGYAQIAVNGTGMS